MEWTDEARQEQAELLRRLLDSYEAGHITADVQRRYAPGTPYEFTALNVVRAIVDLAGYAETIEDESK